MENYEREHLAALRPYLPECTVLLRSSGAFPLDKPCKLALYGNGARRTIKGGTGSGEVNSRFFVTVEQGLEDAGFTITTKKWIDAYDSIREKADKQFVVDMKKKAKELHVSAIWFAMGAIAPECEYDLPLNGEGDVAVYVLSRISGEGNDRTPNKGDIKLTNTECSDILALQKKYARFMLVINTGGPVDLSPLKEVKDILILSQLGVETGAALADILLGKGNPSGKLTTTWSRWEDYADIGSFGDANETRYREGVYVGYRYFDSVGKKAIFPFGYGLSYTTFSIGDPTAKTDREKISVNATVRNTGNRPGKETVQLYVSVPTGELDQPYQTLAGFAKTRELKPGESEEVTVSFAMRELASFSKADAAYILEPGAYVLRLGNSSIETEPVALVKIDSKITVKQVRSSLGEPDFEDWKPERVRPVVVPKGLPELTVSAADVTTETVVYDQDEPVDPVIAALSDDELVYMNIGTFDAKGGLSSIIGSAGRSVAGAAGETTSELKDKGIQALVMADGPAGLRLSEKYFVDDKGIHMIGQAFPKTLADYLPKPVVLLTNLMAKKPKKNDTIYTQYATAIPVGTALAQSWNPAVAELCGDIVGKEMERFGVHLWLAPALNIHRSIQCGRNYEYFSEDPLISGMFAAAITNGVQKHPGCGTTIKHFAANNQEFARYTNNSQVSERAMREIYLRGYEICVRMSQPHALMTSYNLINGQHASERYDLIEDILRSEFGFKGIAMTDWTIEGTADKSAVYPEARADRIAGAGVDLVMPGSAGDYKNIQNALKDGTLSKVRLQKNATRVYAMIQKLCGRK